MCRALLQVSCVTSAGESRAFLQRFPPRTVVAVPRDRLRDAVLEGRLRLVAQAGNLRVAERVTAIVGLAVLDVVHAVPRRAARFEQGGRELLVVELTATAN